MKSRSTIWMMAVFCLTLAVGTAAQAQTKKNLADEVEQSEKAARVFREIMDTPDKGIPQELLENAECVAVFPSVIKAGFIIGRFSSNSPTCSRSLFIFRCISPSMGCSA